MSSDPDRHPIEPGIAPLVFALLLLRLCHPCWSCEGHADPDGTLTRLPQVWFAADSVTYPRLILAHLHTLQFKKRIANPWRVGLSLAESDNPQPLFFVAPDVTLEAAPALDSLRQDIRVIASNLADAVLANARSHLARV